MRDGSPLDYDVFQIASQTLDVFPEAEFDDFGPYRILRLIGKGGMGEVYLAEDTNHQRLVALKFVRDVWNGYALRSHFHREISNLAQLEHAFIARLYESGVHPNGTPFFSMEYVEGKPLDEYCRDNNCSIDDRVRVFREICDAVRYAHSRAVIHLDLKPSNLLVTTDGAPKLLDFGIAKRLDGSNGRAGDTQTQPRFTPAFAAPEQILGQPVGTFTDVYSLGAVFYKLLAGKPPFDLSRATPGEAEALMKDDRDPEKPSAVVKRAGAAKSIWEDLDLICLTALKKNVSERYSSVVELIQDIDHYLKFEPLKTRKDSVLYKTRKFARRHRRRLATAAAVLVIAMGLIGYFTARLAKERNAALAQAARVERIETFMTNLFQGADEEAGPSEDLKVVTLLDRGAKAAQLLNNDPQAQIDLYLTLGTVYETLGQLDKADRLLQSALDESRRVFGTDHEETGRSLLKLGYLEDDEGKPQEAEQLIRSGLAVYKKRNVSMVHPDVGEAMATLGWELDRQGRYEEAKDVLTEDVRLNDSLVGQKKVLSSALSYLGTVYYHQGQYALADFYNQRCIDVDRQLYGPKHPNIAVDLMNFAMTKMQRGQSKEAEKQYREANSIYQNWYGDRHPLTADSSNYVARALMDQGKYDEAAPILKHSLETLKTIFGRRAHTTLAFANDEMGIYCLAKGKFQEAEEHFKKELRIEREIHGNEHPFVGVALTNLGDVHLKSGDLKGAEDYFRQALTRLSGKSDPAYKGQALVMLGRTLLFQKRYPEAESESLAGYAIWAKGQNQHAEWLRNGREDLAQISDALNKPAQAAKFRAELATTQTADARTMNRH